MAVDFPLSALARTLRRLADRKVPHAARLLATVENNPHMRWSDLNERDQSIIRGWRLHLVGMMNRVQGQLQEVKRIMALASEIEKANPHLGRVEFERYATHHRSLGDTDRANAFQLASALRTTNVPSG